MSELNGPRQVILVTSSYGGKENIAPIAWHMPVSSVPELYAICVGKSRYSAELISQSKYFCINFISSSMKEIVQKCGSCSGREHDKFTEFSIEKQDCKSIDCPRLADAIGIVECSLINTIQEGDHLIFIGKVLYSKIFGRKEKRLYHIVGEEFKEL